MKMLEQYLQEGRQIVYGDESGFAVDMPRLSGYSMVGRRCFGLRNFGEKKRTNVIGALCAGSLVTAALFTFNIDTEVFKTWVKDDLLPKLPEKSVFVIDNASFHKHESIKNLLEQQGHKLLFLPPYSPEFNPIEKKWAQAKQIRRTHQCSLNELFQKYSL